ncbi:MAG TPA: deoxynucleoside kinase [Planctomycetota bacterium]|nr:deoxynucleoside kinase [Planctomycetota bacterium]
MPSYVAIEGVMGSGKTTLARLVADRLSIQNLVETMDIHPFMKAFYADRAAYTLETELCCALIHYHQLNRAKREGVFEQHVIADFHLYKDMLFAVANMSGPELECFRQLYAFLESRVGTPSLLLYLRAPARFLSERMKRRGRTMEEGVPIEYLEHLSRVYDEYFAALKNVPVITLQAEKYDFLERPGDIEAVVNMLQGAGEFR